MEKQMTTFNAGADRAEARCEMLDSLFSFRPVSGNLAHCHYPRFVGTVSVKSARRCVNRGLPEM